MRTAVGMFLLVACLSVACTPGTPSPADAAAARMAEKMKEGDKLPIDMGDLGAILDAWQKGIYDERLAGRWLIFAAWAPDALPQYDEGQRHGAAARVPILYWGDMTANRMIFVRPDPDSPRVVWPRWEDGKPAPTVRILARAVPSESCLPWNGTERITLICMKSAGPYSEDPRTGPKQK